MPAIGVLLLAVGVWVMYCGAYGLDPAALARAIIADPQNAQKLISDARLAAAEKTAAAGGVSNGTPLGSGDGAAVVAFARKQIGQPYVFGGHASGGWDCSGLTMEAYASVGVTLPHSALAQSRMGVPIATRKDLQPGDLLFPTGVGTALGDHVQIYSGGGNIVEAARPGTNVRERAMWGFSGDSVTARRLIKKQASTSQTAGDYYGAGAPKSSGNSSGTPAGNTAGNYYGSGAG